MATCVSCNKREGNPYLFVYGNDLPANRQGTQPEPICDQCIREAKAAEIVRGLIALIVTSGVIALVFYLLRGYIFVTPKQYFDQAFITRILVAGLYLFSAIAWISIFVGLMKRFFIKHRRIGEGLALMADRETLGKKYKQLWTMTKYEEELKKKVGR